MNIAIDSRFYGLEHAGLGRYTMNLIQELAKIDSSNQYTLFVFEKYKDLDLPSNFQTLVVNAKHHSFAEQILLARAISINKYDLVHFPHFIVPILNLTTPFVVTIHDLIKHKHDGLEATTLSPWKYYLKRVAYRFDIWWAVHKSKHIVTPTQFVKEEIVKWFDISADKVSYTHEGVDLALSCSESSERTDEILTKFGLTKPYILYVGNSYPYKQVTVLLDALSELPNEISLVLVGSRSVFLERVEQQIKDREIDDRVHALGYVADDELGVIYQNALAYTTATLEEGFGITPLEAMGMSCPTIISDIPVHREVCGDASLYFNPQHYSELVNAVTRLYGDDSVRASLVEKGKNRTQMYSWNKMARETLQIYTELTS